MSVDVVEVEKGAGSGEETGPKDAGSQRGGSEPKRGDSAIRVVPEPLGEGSEGTRRWSAHRLAAVVLRAAIIAVPAVVTAVAVMAVARRVPRPIGGGAVLWWASMLALGALVYIALERLGRRFLPLAALLRLSLVLPDHTASRYRIALRAGTTRHLREVVEAARRGELAGATPAESAERVLLLVAALNRHDRLTRGHSERVRAYAEVIGEQMGLRGAELERLRWAALLHDVGKVVVPSEVLNKRGRLTDEEFEIIKTHPKAGAEMVEPLREWLGDAVDAVGQHHERFDGNGYPNELAGTDISLSARIVSVADTFDVITSTRSYKRAMSPAAARAEITRCAGTQFDPKVSRALVEVSLGRLWLAGGPLTWLASVPALAQLPSVGMVPALGNAAVAAATAAVVAGGALAPNPGADHADELAALPAPTAATASTNDNGPAALEDRTERSDPEDGQGGDPMQTTAAATDPAADPAAPVDTVVDPTTGQRVPVDPTAPRDETSGPAPAPTAPGTTPPPGTTGTTGGSQQTLTGTVNDVLGQLPVTGGLEVDVPSLPVVGQLPIVGQLPTITVPPVTVPPVVDDLLGGVGGLLGGRRR